MIRQTMTAALAATILAGPPAIAQGTTAVTDGEITQCIVAVSRVSKTLTGIDQASVDAVGLYFIGKLAARHTPAEIKVLIERAEAENAKKDLSPAARECASEAKELGATLQGK